MFCVGLMGEGHQAGVYPGGTITPAGAKADLGVCGQTLRSVQAAYVVPKIDLAPMIC